ncbi:hypothetical protein GW17_00059179 [Ensete ventricosum]|nr:hypothetical protein GW17_00059179 [Ensete ventricosum]
MVDEKHIPGTTGLIVAEVCSSGVTELRVAEIRNSSIVGLMVAEIHNSGIVGLMVAEMRFRMARIYGSEGFGTKVT